MCKVCIYQIYILVYCKYIYQDKRQFDQNDISSHFCCRASCRLLPARHHIYMMMRDTRPGKGVILSYIGTLNKLSCYLFISNGLMGIISWCFIIQHTLYKASRRAYTNKPHSTICIYASYICIRDVIYFSRVARDRA